MALMDLLIGAGAVLDSPIRVMDQRLCGLPGLEGHFQRLTDLLRLQTVMDVIPHDLSGISIRDQAQVNALLLRRQIGDVSDPDLFAGGGLEGAARLEQIRMLAEAMMAVRGLMVRPLGGNQHPGVAQDAEQRIPSHLNAMRLLQHVLQLARPQPRLT